MSLIRLIAQRVALGFTAAWAVLSLVFAMFTLPENYALGRTISLAAYNGADEKELEQLRNQFLSRRGRDRPVLEQYIDWQTNMYTLDWGRSFETGQEVFPQVQSATVTTGTYVLPAIVLATVVALAVGVYSAVRASSYSDSGVRGLVYALFGLPNFWLGVFVLVYAGAAGYAFGLNPGDQITASDQPFLYSTVVPAILVTTTLVAAVASYARAYALEQVNSKSTKLVRAKGGGQVAVARHVLRNAAIPLVSLVFTETLALLALSVFVIESLFGIEGLGMIFFNAVQNRDMPMLLGGTMVVVVVGVVGNIVQDIAYSVLDPRVDTGTR